MYLHNKYHKWYFNIIYSAKLRVNHSSRYTENHHIIPRSLGGDNSNENLVRLTPKEHYVCHMLLPKFTEGIARSKMIRAAWMIATMGNKNQKRIKVNSLTYCRLKEEWLKVSANKGPMSEETKQKLRKSKTDDHKAKISAARKGKTYGYTHSEETKRKISESQKGRPGRKRTDIEKIKQSEAIRGRKYSIEHRMKIAESNRRRGSPSEETRRKISESLKKRNRENN